MTTTIKVELSQQELEIILDYLPASYKDETPEAVKDLKLKIYDLSRSVN